MPFKSEKQRRWMWANDPEMAEEWEEKEKKENKAMKITKEQIRRIIKEEKAKLLSEQPGTPMGKGLIMELGDALDELSHWSSETDRLMNEASRQFGELANQTTHSRRIMNETEEMANRFDEAIDVIFGRME